MKSRWIAVFWGLVMIAAGVLFFIDQQGLIDLNILPTRIMALIFAVLSAFFFLTYVLKGVRNWGWLFPATILGGIALIMGTEGTRIGDLLSGAPVLIGIAIPFASIFLLDKKSNWWAIIPAWVMAAIALVVLFEDRVNDNVIGAFVLFSIALPFFAVYLIDHNRRWALIPFASLTAIGLIPLLENVLSDDMMGMAVMFLFAAPFFVVYFWSKKNWWAFIPAGVFTSIGLVVLLSYSFLSNFNRSGFNPAGTALLLSGFGITFGLLWLRRAVQPTGWAKYPALGLIAAAVFFLIVSEKTQSIWPVILIILGAVILIASYFRKPNQVQDDTKK